MPGKRKKIYTDGIYHVFNKTIDSKKIFNIEENSKLFIQTIEYYRSTKARIGLAAIKKLQPLAQRYLLKEVQIPKYFRIQILAYTLMPTHYHLLLLQKADGGISRFIGDSINSFTRNLNIKKDRKGPIFLTKYKSVQVVNDEHLMHISRYIHLNCYSSGLVSKLDEISSYPWSSYSEYIKQIKGICYTNTIMSYFENDPKQYRDFVENHAEYQKTLEYTKHTKSWI